MNTSALSKAVEIVGGQKALAEAIGVRQGHVWNWLNRNKGPVPPAEFCSAIEAATNGKVSCRDLRPDVFVGKAA